jgi:hypothetical protein
MKLLHDLGPIDRFPYLAGIGLDLEDLGRVEVAEGSVSDPGLYVDAATGASQLLVEGDRIPEGVWVAQQAIDDLKPDGGADIGGEHGAGQGWGRQGPQLGGDRSFPEEDTGGTVRDTPNHEDARDDSPATL